jgi:hypothetical protein
MSARDKEVHCRSLFEELFIHLSRRNFAGIKQHVEAMKASCGDKGGMIDADKLTSKIDEFGDNAYAEEAAVNYHATWLDNIVFRNVPWNRRVAIYHDMHSSWVWATYASVALGPLAANAYLRRMQKR